MENETKHLIWAITLIATTIILCGTLIYLNQNAWTMRFEMDDNTKEAIQSIEFDEIGSADSMNLWVSPSENWTMITYSNNTLYINGDEQGKTLEALQ